MSRHIIHVGYPKAGSTFLQAWFERHPELRFVDGGLGGFRNVFELARPSAGAYKYFVTSREDLSAPREGAGENPSEVAFEWMTHTERMKEHRAAVCGALKGLFPGSLILIVTRGFMGSIRSGYSQYVKMGGQLGAYSDSYGAVREDAVRYISAFYDFDHVIGLYAGAFGEENVMVLPYELLRDDQARFLSTLESRLGLNHVEIELGRLNPSLSPEELYWYPIISRAVSAAAGRLGAERHRRVYDWYVGKISENRLRRLVGVLRRLYPDRRVTAADFPDELVAGCRGKATLLKDDPLYAPYAAEYLLTDELPD